MACHGCRYCICPQSALDVFFSRHHHEYRIEQHIRACPLYYSIHPVPDSGIVGAMHASQNEVHGRFWQ